MGSAKIEKQELENLQEQFSEEEQVKILQMANSKTGIDRTKKTVSKKDAPAKSGVDDYKDEVGLKDKKGADDDDVLSAELRKIYSDESVFIAEQMIDGVADVLLGNRLTYHFDEKDTGVSGLSFTFRSLNSSEENDIKFKCRNYGWDHNITGHSMDLFWYEQIQFSLVEYCGKDLRAFKTDDRTDLIKRIPGFLMTRMFEKQGIFRSALELLARGKGDLDIIKKSLAPQA